MPFDSNRIDLDAILSDVRAMRREASTGAKRSHVEFYAKISQRVRVERRDDDVEPTTHRVLESGMAARVRTAAKGGAGFAAASGMSERIAAWIAERATRADALATAAGLDRPGTGPDVRWDLDPPDELPETSALVTALRMNLTIRWVEAGTTLEILAGADDRCAVRRRNRIWAQLSHARTQLVAKRSFTGWEQLLAPRSPGGDTSAPRAKGAGPLLFTPDAASTVVVALVAAVHGEEEPPIVASEGPGWTVADDPGHPDGLAGGSTDDAGFDSRKRPLAENGRILDRLSGPGTYRRSSFREPPFCAPSNLSVPSGDSAADPAAVHVLGCRVIRLGSELWVLDLDLHGGRRGYARVSPRSLLSGCVASVGPQQVTANGPIVPGLVFEGLELIQRA